MPLGAATKILLRRAASLQPCRSEEEEEPLVASSSPMGLQTEIEDDYSAAATTVVFDRPIPLLRGPVLSNGSYVLAFRSLDSWSAAFKRCETIIKEQCEEGARIGCAVSASKNCKPPWWRGSADMRQREKCEEREFEVCVAAAMDKCASLAKDKCSRAFLEVRIASEVERLVWLASMPEESTWRDLMGLGSLVQTKCYRARDLLNHKSNF